jgi:hypothetical protein
MEIPLKLEKTCIETRSRRTYETLLRRYLKGGISDAEKRRLERQIEALKSFLETTDFGLLRSAHKELRGNENAHIILKTYDQPSRFQIICNDIIIDSN